MLNDPVVEKFKTVLLNRPPNWKSILNVVKPRDTVWIGRFRSEKWPPYTTNSETINRLHGIRISGLKQWASKDYLPCTGSPCDVPTYQIGFGGFETVETVKETIAARTDTLCYDQIRDVTHARETLQFWINQVLAPTTVAMTSEYIRMKAALLAGQKWVCNTTMTPFTFSFVANAAGEYEYILCNVDPTTIKQLTPQHLQYRVMRRLYDGIDGGSQIEGLNNRHEVVVDANTIWSLDKQVNTGTSNIAQYWRFQSFDAASKYWSFNIPGQIGDCVLVRDMEQIRLVYVGPESGLHKYRIIRPYKNTPIVDGEGKMAEVNDDYLNAPFAFGFFTEPEALVLLLGSDAEVNPQMPFVKSGLAGEWRFFVPQDEKNFQGNKGWFWAKWELAMRPAFPNRVELFLYQVPPITPPSITMSSIPSDFGSQPTNEAPETCTVGPFTFPSGWDNIKKYVVLANSVSVNDLLLSHLSADGGEESTDTAARQGLVSALNAEATLKKLGTWALDSSNNLVLTYAKYQSVRLSIQLV